MKKLHILCILCVSLLVGACKKPAGTGGNSSIKGNVWVQDYNKSLTIIQYQYTGVDIDVYIIYGDETSYGDKIKTNGDGEFEFKYLRKGNYKIYAVSQERIGVTNDSKDVAVTVEATITGKKQSVDVGQITIKK
ncbi:MAG: hypothetical protein V4506_06615 [Bacteroidota bacterium]